MKNPWERYLSELWEQWHLLAVWEPTTLVELGDVGTMEKKVWRKVDSLAARGVAFNQSRSNTRSDRSYSSAGEVHLDTGGSAGAVGVPAQGEVKVSFHSKGTVRFDATGCEEVRIADVGSLEAEIWRLFEAGQWDPRHVVVTKVVEVERAAILIARGKSGEAKFSVSANAGLDFGAINLASASLGARLVHTNELVGAYVAESLTPIFEAICIDRDGLLMRRSVGPATPRGGHLEPVDGTDDPQGGVIPYRYEYEELLGDED